MKSSASVHCSSTRRASQRVSNICDKEKQINVSFFLKRGVSQYLVCLEIFFMIIAWKFKKLLPHSDNTAAAATVVVGAVLGMTSQSPNNFVGFEGINFH